MLSHYEELLEGNFLGPIGQAIDSGTLELLPTGRIRMKIKYVTERPWINAGVDPNRACDLWHKWYFGHYGIVPKGCRNCWKIVYKPRDLNELFTVHEAQEVEGKNSKCGIERRAYSGNEGGYAAFWYADIFGGLAGGREEHKQVKLLIERLRGRPGEVILKRGCTEMERRFPQSQLWDEASEEWDAVEELLDERFIPTSYSITEPPELKVLIRQRWIHFAAEHGDLTYLDHTGGQPLVVAPVTYHEGEQDALDFQGDYNGFDSRRYERREGEELFSDWPKPGDGQIPAGGRPSLTLL